MLFLGSEKYPAKSYFDDVWEMLGLAKLVTESQPNARLAYSARIAGIGFFWHDDGPFVPRWYLALNRMVLMSVPY
jgi:hypothetical protein